MIKKMAIISSKPIWGKYIYLHNNVLYKKALKASEGFVYKKEPW